MEVKNANFISMGKNSRLRRRGGAERWRETVVNDYTDEWNGKINSQYSIAVYAQYLKVAIHNCILEKTNTILGFQMLSIQRNKCLRQ